MKTIIELPDALLIAAKKRAADLRCTLRTLIERGLRHELSQLRARHPDTTAKDPLGHRSGRLAASAPGLLVHGPLA